MRVGAVRDEEAHHLGLRRRIGEVARQQHALQRHPRHLRTAARRCQVRELRQLVEPPVERGPVARAKRLLEAARQGAVVVIERRARRVSRGLQLAAEARDEHLRIERFERAERERPWLQHAAVEPADEDVVEPDGARAPAAEHAKHVVADRARIALGEEHDRLQHLGRGALEVGTGVDLGEILQRRARAALALRTLVDQLGQGAPEARVLRRDGQGAALQAALRDVGRANAARRVRAARVERPLHAVEHDAGRGVVFRQLGVDVLGDLPRHAGVRGDADGGQRKPRNRAAGERRRAEHPGGDVGEQARQGWHG